MTAEQSQTPNRIKIPERLKASRDEMLQELVELANNPKRRQYAEELNRRTTRFSWKQLGELYSH